MEGGPPAAQFAPRPADQEPRQEAQQPGAQPGAAASGAGGGGAAAAPTPPAPPPFGYAPDSIAALAAAGLGQPGQAAPQLITAAGSAADAQAAAAAGAAQGTPPPDSAAAVQQQQQQQLAAMPLAMPQLAWATPSGVTPTLAEAAAAVAASQGAAAAAAAPAAAPAAAAAAAAGSILKPEPYGEEGPVEGPPPKKKPGRQRRTSVLCQVPGCGAELVNEKGYYRRYRICQTHCSMPSMMLEGREQRFCQQCGRFQGIGEFEGSKKSCRRKLKRHNERRRVEYVREGSREPESEMEESEEAGEPEEEPAPKAKAPRPRRTASVGGPRSRLATASSAEGTDRKSVV